MPGRAERARRIFRLGLRARFTVAFALGGLVLSALLASVIIVYNAIGVIRPATQDLMDRAPGEEMISRVAAAAAAVPGVSAIEKLKVRKAGMGYYVDLHVQADPAMPLHAAHVLSGMVKSAIREAVPEVTGALIHMEPYEADGGAGTV